MAAAASESVAIESAGFTFEANVQPGEAVLFDVRDRNIHSRVMGSNEAHSPCLFEFVYLARPDSIIDGISVYKSRLRMGDHHGNADMVQIEFPRTSSKFPSVPWLCLYQDNLMSKRILKYPS